MSNSKFTKGPWWVGTDAWLGGHVAISAETHGAFALVLSDMEDKNFPGYEKKVDELKANASLIALAPEYYREVDSIIEWLEFMSGEFVLGSPVNVSIHERISRLRVLQHKARGKS